MASASECEQELVPADSHSTSLIAPTGAPTVYGPRSLQIITREDSTATATSENPHPFWSERAQAEWELARSRPLDLALREREQQTEQDEPRINVENEQADGAQMGSANIQQDRSEQNEQGRSRSTSPGVRAILQEMKGLLTYLVGTADDHRQRLDRLEQHSSSQGGQDLQSACSAHSGSAGRQGDPIVQSVPGVGSNNVESSGFEGGNSVGWELQGGIYPVFQGKVGRPTAIDPAAGSGDSGLGSSGCQHFYIGGPRGARRPSGGVPKMVNSNSKTPPLLSGSMINGPAYQCVASAAGDGQDMSRTRFEAASFGHSGGNGRGDTEGENGPRGAGGERGQGDFQGASVRLDQLAGRAPYQSDMSNQSCSQVVARPDMSNQSCSQAVATSDMFTPQISSSSNMFAQTQNQAVTQSNLYVPTSQFVPGNAIAREPAQHFPQDVFSARNPFSSPMPPGEMGVWQAGGTGNGGGYHLVGQGGNGRGHERGDHGQDPGRMAGPPGPGGPEGPGGPGGPGFPADRQTGLDGATGKGRVQSGGSGGLGIAYFG